MTDSGADLHNWIRDLWSIPRSVVGVGIEDSMSYLLQLLNSPSKIHEFDSGTVIGGWTVPQAWSPKTAVIRNLIGQTVVDFKENNLHLWSHSRPFKGRISRRDLEAHLLTLPELPTAIPYATTYYADNWGFSVNYDQYVTLLDDYYDVDVDVDLSQGKMPVLEIFLPGESEAEVFFSTYLCHPSMANNELSGPVVATALIRHLEKRNRRYSYRFVFGPETIGAIAYLSNFGTHLRNNVKFAFNLTCVGGGSEWSLLESPEGNTRTDRIAHNLLEHHVDQYRTYPFLERGSDERQYCSPLVNLPMVSIMRSKYHEYREYHNSLDDLSFVTPDRLQETLDFYMKLLEVLEHEGCFLSTSVGEPFLSDKTDYPKIGGRLSARNNSDYKLISDFVALSTNRTLTQIATLMGESAFNLRLIAKKCVELGLVTLEIN